MTDIRELSGAELIEALSLEFGPSGCEDRVRDMIEARVKNVAHSIKKDKLGNLVCQMSFGNKDSSERKKIMLSAHMDEVGFMIDGIRSDGMLTFGCIGGIDASVLAGRKVFVGNEKKLINGVICSKAIHHKEKDERQKAVSADKLYIDIGHCSKEESETHVSIGDFAAFDSEFYRFGKNGGTLKGKALDDRMGCAAMIEIMDCLAKEPIDSCVDVYFCFTVREEIGYSGAGCVAASISPHLALVLESTAIGDIPDTPAHKRVADVGKGVVISVADRATIYDRDTVERVLEIAKKNKIAAQIKRYVSGGNDAGKIHKEIGGIKTLALSVPTRYLHSPSCVAAIDDYAALRELTVNIVKAFAKGEAI